MTVAQFKQLISLIKRTWDSKEGSVVILSSPAKSIHLCIGTYRNTGIMAEYGMLWDNEDENLLYMGELDSVELQKILTANKICGVSITSVKAMGRSTMCCTEMCLKGTAMCPHKLKCKLKKV
jgi:hypothetical protein